LLPTIKLVNAASVGAVSVAVPCAEVPTTIKDKYKTVAIVRSENLINIW
jgi:hypothetical protein